MAVEPQKRGRGRPRKHPVCLPSPAVQCEEIQPKKRKRGRPRLSDCVSSVPSSLPVDPVEEEEETIGRPYESDSSWHPGDNETLNAT